MIDASGNATMGPLKISRLSRALCLDIIHNMKSRRQHGNSHIPNRDTLFAQKILSSPLSYLFV